MNRKFGLVLALVLAIAVIALAASPGLAQADSEEQLTTVAHNMHEHLGRISTIKSSIITGKLEAVRDPAIWIADHETTAALPADYEFYIAQMRTHARQNIMRKWAVSRDVFILSAAWVPGQLLPMSEANSTARSSGYAPIATYC